MLVALLLSHAHVTAGCSKLVGAGTFDNGHYNDDDHQMNVVDRFVPGTVPERLWVSRIEASPHDADRAYVAFTGYREDIRDPYLYMTEDGGVSFRSIAGGLPQGESVNVVREHPWNDQCLLVGTEFTCQVSIDAGATWHELGSGLPTVPVHDLVVHPRDGDVVIGTHGRGFWILDAAFLGELTAESLARSFVVFDARDGYTAAREFLSVRYPGDRGWSAPAAELAAVFRYYLREDLGRSVDVEVFDITGERVFSADGSGKAGLHEVVWRARGRRARAASAGDYRVKVTAGDDAEERVFRVWPAPRSPR